MAKDKQVPDLSSAGLLVLGSEDSDWRFLPIPLDLYVPIGTSKNYSKATVFRNNEGERKVFAYDNDRYFSIDKDGNATLISGADYKFNLQSLPEKGYFKVKIVGVFGCGF